MATHEDKASSTAQAGLVTDARGRTVTQLDPVLMHLLHRHGMIPPDTLRKIADEVGVGLSRAARVGFWLSLISIALAVLCSRWPFTSTCWPRAV